MHGSKRATATVSAALKNPSQESKNYFCFESLRPQILICPAYSSMQIPNLGILAIEICYKLLQHLQILTTFHVLPLARYTPNEKRVVLVYDHFAHTA